MSMDTSLRSGTVAMRMTTGQGLLEVLPRFRSIQLDRLPSMLMYLGFAVVFICGVLFWTDSCVGRGEHASTYRQLIAHKSFAWPTISHTGASFPARPIFQAGIQWMGSILLIVLWAVHSAVYCRVIHAASDPGTTCWWPLMFNSVSLCLGCLFALMMIPTGAISLEEYEYAHNMCAAGTFLFALLHVSVYIFGHRHPVVRRVLLSTREDKRAFRQRVLIFAAILLPGFLFGVWSNVAQRLNPDCLPRGHHEGWCEATNWMAVSEYYFVFGLGLFLRSFRHELSGHFLAVTKTPQGAPFERETL